MIKKLIFNNFLTKVSALLLAVLLWFYISGEENIEITKEIPLTVRLGGDFVMTGVTAGSVKVTLKGAREIMKNVDWQKISASKDLTNADRAGNITFTLSDREINVPKFTNLTGIEPSEITAVVDKLVEKDLTVEPVLQNRPSLGFSVEKISSNPAIVKVKGPKAALEKMVKINTLPIDLTGRNKSFSQKTETEPILGKFAGKEPIEISVSIRELSEKKSFEKIPIGILKSADQKYDVRLEPQTADITITGPSETVAHTEAKDIKCFVDIENLKEGDYELPVQTRIPKDLSVLRLSPVNVKVSLKEENISLEKITEKPMETKKEEL